MTETYYVVKQNIEACCLLNKPNEILYKTNSIREAKQAFKNITRGKMVYPEEFNKGVYLLLSQGHYQKFPKAIRVIDTNTYPCD